MHGLCGCGRNTSHRRSLATDFAWLARRRPCSQLSPSRSVATCLVGGVRYCAIARNQQRHRLSPPSSCTSPSAAPLAAWSGCAPAGHHAAGHDAMALMVPAACSHETSPATAPRTTTPTPRSSWSCHRRLTDFLDDATRQHWEQITGQRFDLDYRTVQRPLPRLHHHPRQHQWAGGALRRTQRTTPCHCQHPIYTE